MISYDSQPPTCYRCNEIGHQQIDCPRKKRLEPLAVRRESTWADVLSKSIQEPNTHTQMRQANTTQGHRTESPTRLVDRPVGTEQCVHPQDTQALPTATDVNTLMTGQQSMAPDYRPKDTKETFGECVAASDQITTDEQTWASMSTTDMTGTPDNRTTSELDTWGKQINDTECKLSTMDRRHSLDSNSDRDSTKEDATVAAPLCNIGRTKKIKIDRDETALRTRNRSKTRNKTYK